ncbi:hypothetical protein NS07_v2contig00155-0008 [Nocardia seriolae]|nr:hypothetical protein NS14008_15340 [Nocardia seriolae]PSK29143.1 hypothetical protein C6575_22625 [Nocardia seriolae]RLP29851.1 hypothetical protein D6158_21650 [Nocardia seriolae]GAM50482.1 hypothetical protein NS07_v2contig00155-0008 [Nocardia seriolae]
MRPETGDTAMNAPDDSKMRTFGTKWRMPGLRRPVGHVWMMVLCSLPMLAIALTLVLTGVVPAGLLVIAFACAAMMALMMVGAGGDHRM